MARQSLLDRIALLGRSGLNIVQAMGRSLIFLWSRWRRYWHASAD